MVGEERVRGGGVGELEVRRGRVSRFLVIGGIWFLF